MADRRTEGVGRGQDDKVREILVGNPNRTRL